MRRHWLVGIGLVTLAIGAWLGYPSPPGARGQGGLGRVDGGPLLAFDGAAADGSRQLVVIDPQRRVMGIYQIDPKTSAIKLKSVRQLQWDLAMDEFNSSNPSPQEIRDLIQQPPQ